MKINEGPKQQVIIAQCTPNGSGAIALIRLSGNNVRQIVGKMSKITSKKTIEDLPSHTISYGWVLDEENQTIDQVLFFIMDSPKSFTGENVIEITCHNNPFIIEAIIGQAINHGARLAQEGEFTRRAFENNKIDLLQAEAINELINANTQAAIKKSLAQVGGSFSSWIAEIEKKLIHSLAFCQASFEFLDEEQEFSHIIQDNLKNLLSTINNIKDSFDIQNQIRQGIRIALIGSVNAGKSSIFNALLNQKRAIVTNIAGTTRDVIEAGIYRNGNYWTLIDTAGLRKTNDIIEKEGIRRSFSEAEKADIILLIFDSSRKLSKQELKIYREIHDKHKQKLILVKNKIDLPELTNLPQKKDTIAVSGSNKNGIKVLENRLEEKIQNILDKAQSPFLINKRQFNILLNLEKKLLTIENMLKDDIQYELVAYHINDALEDTSELTGKSISEIGMDAVFKEFCVGK